MDNKKQKIFTTSTTKNVLPNGEVAVHQQVIKRPEEVILTIGVFFDGTANNSFNIAMREEYQQALARGETPEISFPVFNTSYTNDHSNVYKLYQMYASDEEKEFSLLPNDKNGIVHCQLKVYIEGVGSRIGEKDSNIGFATGLGSTGVKGKINRAIIQIKNLLKEFLDKAPKKRIQQINYNVFGFSRGAATARYFTNFVADKLKYDDKRGDNNPLTKMLKQTLDGKISDHWQGHVNGRVSFLGIFDTVAGIGRPENLFDAGDANTFDIDIHIHPDSIDAGLHIEAAHEYRHNFSLNTVPSYFKKVIVPGAHSDIGGGYPNNDIEENLYITDVYQHTDLYLGQQSNIRKKLQKALTKIQQHPDLPYIFYGLSEENFYQWTTPVRYDNQSYTNAYGVIRIKRLIKFGLDRIALRIMYNEAVKNNCHFDIFDKDHEIPNELQNVAIKVIKTADNYQNYQLTDAEKRLVLNNYVHSSSEYERYFYTKPAEKELIDKNTGQIVKISWPTKKAKEHAKTGLLQVHQPHLNDQGCWQRLVHPDR
ncbi:T6SS phospholipase effector Tle1-like catalytic domain-containing protein [Gilliamella apicola]|uniref:T6SS phospholipase effector Tle1-like catalytic domain-containing protein n=1 Tax=Gilliamella apicola TaxID=1196095 RepID=UPI00398624D3